MLDICDLLALKGFDLNAKTKMVRHQNKKYDFNELCRRDMLAVYQSYQSKPVFECEYVVSFIGHSSTKAIFYGVYSVNGRKEAKEVPLTLDFPYPNFASDAEHYYELEEVPGFEDLKGRVVIEWGKSTRSWHQNLRQKEVVEILPMGYVREFPGYLDFTLHYDELVEIIKNPEANREWHRMLAAVAGIYLIADAQTGKQYIGSAYGEKGIFGRWIEYARSVHGGNSLLKELVSNSPDYAQNFKFTILDTLPKTHTQKEVIEREVLWKNKLGSRAFGLNIN